MGATGEGRAERALTLMCWPSIFTDTPCGSLIGTLPMRLSFGVSCFRATHWKGPPPLGRWAAVQRQALAPHGPLHGCGRLLPTGCDVRLVSVKCTAL